MNGSPIIPPPSSTTKRKKGKRVNPMLVVTLAVVVVGGLGFAYRYRENKANSTEVTAQYQYTRAQQGDIYVTISGSGTLEASAKAVVTPKTTGEIAQLLKSEGDWVEAGEVIAVLDADEYKMKLTQAESDLNAAKVKLDTAKQDKDLYPVEASASLEQAKSALIQAKKTLQELLDGPKASELEQLKSSVRSAKANYDSVNADYLRSKSLFEQGAISRQDFDNAEVKKVSAYEQYVSAQQKFASGTEKATADELASARAQVKQAENNLKLAQQQAMTNKKTDAFIAAQTNYESAKINLEQAKKNLLNTKITAPISGTLWSMSVNIGDSVSAATQLATVVNTSKLYANVAVDEADITKVTLGQAAHITVDAIEDVTYNGSVVRIAPEATSNNGVSSYEVVVEVNDDRKTLKPGMNANADILINYVTGVITIPTSAVQERNGRSTVLVDSKGEATPVRVTTGLKDDSNVQVLSGIKEGDRVVTNPEVATTTTDATASTTSTQGNGTRALGLGGGGPMGGFRP